MTQTHLADMLSLTPVHVNRTLKALREDELAHVRRGKVEIMDWDRIEAAGEFDPTYLQFSARN